VLVVVDVLNGYRRGGGPEIVSLVDAARERDVLTVYVNDNFQDWTLDRRALLERVTDCPHRRLVERWPRTIFWQTSLDYLLPQSGIDRLVLCGQVTEQCILYSALDAHVREYGVTVARDACASIDPELAEAALRLMETNMHARIAPSAEALEPE